MFPHNGGMLVRLQRMTSLRRRAQADAVLRHGTRGNSRELLTFTLQLYCSRI